MPIYVFESNDEEQLIKEERSDIRDALMNTFIGKQTLKDGDVSTDTSDLEEDVDKESTKKVQCKCLHGICDEGKSICSRCDSGW